MSSSLKPIHLYASASGPNAWKVAIILEELQLPYEMEFVAPTAIKQPAILKLNVNGRVPIIQDPNTDITLWESGAILEYIVETYDKSNTFAYTTFPEKFLVKQWLHFQMSGQGPYYGQASWFNKIMPVQVPLAIERYKEQLIRVLGVLNTALEGKEYLVGDKVTYADLAFLPWNTKVPWIFGDEYKDLDIENKYPNYFAWNARLMSRPAVKKVFERQKTEMSRPH